MSASLPHPAAERWGRRALWDMGDLYEVSVFP